MKKFIIILAVICYGNLLWSQDIITLKTGEEIKAVVQEIGLTDVKYKKYENPNGPTYNLLKSDIFMIKYENGSKDMFNEVTEKKQPIQTQSKIISNQKMLQTKMGFWSGQVVDYTGRVLKRSEVRALMAATPNALSHYNNSVILNTGAIIIDIGAIGLSLYGVCFAPKKDFWGYVGGAAGCLIGGVIWSLAGNFEMKKSVNLYNNSINKSYAFNMKFGLTNSGGLGFTLNF